MHTGKKLRQKAAAGFEQKNDLLVLVSQGQPGSGVQVNLSSPVMRQYGEHIRKLIMQTVTEKGFNDLIVQVKDQGAWDYTIKARVSSALERGMQND